MSSALLAGPQHLAIATGYEPLVRQYLEESSRTPLNATTGSGKRSEKALRDKAISASGDQPYHLLNGVAFIKVVGTLLPSMPDWYYEGDHYTGYSNLREKLEHAFQHDDTKAICFAIDSPGGYVAGLYEFCDWFLSAKKRYGKPVLSLVDGNAYSAAYAIASLADHIVCNPYGGIGSIGTMCVHWDMSAYFERFGDKPTLIFSGETKVDGNMYEALSDRARVDLQSSVDESRTTFANIVARGRADVGLTVQGALDTEARCYDRTSGLNEAVKLKLIDAISPPERAVLAFIEEVNDGG